MLRRALLLVSLFVAFPASARQATTNPDAPQAPAAPVPTTPMTGPGRAGWWNDAVFYQVFVRSFADGRNGPLANDGIGDLQGLIEHLDYLNDGDPKTSTDLGVTALWLMPIMQSPSYHGYDTTDYANVERDYGTNDDFKRLVAESHKRGIKVIIDLVLNHLSCEHPWFVEAIDPASPKHDWFLWTDEAPAYKGLWGQNVWHAAGACRGGGAKAAAAQFPNLRYYGLFGPEMPDINYRCAAASDAMLGVTRFWLKDLGADGYRLDAIRHLIENGPQQDNTPETHEWLRSFAKTYKQENPEAFAVGEVWAGSTVAASYIPGQMDAVFEFDLAEAMTTALITGKADGLKSTQQRVLNLYPPNQYGRFLSNHDQTRIMTRLKEDPQAMRAAAALLLLGPGIPFIYYGEEIGLPGDKPDPKLRTPMPWNASDGGGFSRAKPWQDLSVDPRTNSVAAQSSNPRSLLSWYRTLIRTRMNFPALRSGQTVMVDASHPGVIAWLCTPDPGVAGSPVLVAVNVSKTPAEPCTFSLGSSPLRGSYAGADAITGTELAPLTSALRGGFTGYAPLPRIDPGHAALIKLTPAGR